MRMHRRAALAAVALLSAVSLAACGGSASTPTTEASDAASSGAAAEQVSGEINVFAAASLKKAYEDIGAAFQEANPDATVNFEFLGSQELLSNLSEGSAADVLATADTDIMDSAVSQIRRSSPLTP